MKIKKKKNYLKSKIFIMKFSIFNSKKNDFVY
jgi:hypothetical protein